MRTTRDGNGRFIEGAHRPDMVGECNPRWAGNSPSYNAAHLRITVARGRASERVCMCGKRLARDWASLTGNYVDIWDYQAMCSRCHHRRDKGKLITHNGESMCLTAWAEFLGIPKGTLFSRFYRGWSVERMLTP